MYLNVLEFEYLMAVFFSFLENQMSTLGCTSQTFWPNQLPTIIRYFVLVNLFIIYYCNYFTIAAIRKNENVLSK